MVEGKNSNEASNSNVGFEKRRFGHNWNLKNDPQTKQQWNSSMSEIEGEKFASFKSSGFKQGRSLISKSTQVASSYFPLPRLNPLDLVKAKLVHN